jgi:hypothetical protein
MRLFCVLCAFLLAASVAVAAEPVAGEYVMSSQVVDGNAPVAVRLTSVPGIYFWYMPGLGKGTASIKKKCVLVKFNTESFSVCEDASGELNYKDNKNSLPLIRGQVAADMYYATMEIDRFILK